MSDVRISVVMACYHGDQLGPLGEAVDSVLGQTLGPSEFIIVVDGPVGPEVSRYLRRLDAERDTVRVVWLAKNKGAAAARNYGMSLAQGDYIAIMDSDDILLPHRLEVQYRAVQEHGVDAVWGWQEEFYSDSGTRAGIKVCPQGHQDILRSLKFRNLLSDPTTFVKAEVVREAGGYGPLPNIGYDYQFFVEIALKGFKMHCVPEPLIRVRVSPEQRRRRGGWKLLNQDYALRRWMLDRGFINPAEFAWTLAVYGLVRLQPNFARDVLYRRVLRRPCEPRLLGTHPSNGAF